MKIAGFDTNKSPLLIAEIGNNHEGDPELAMRLVHAAISSGADMVKVQVIDPQQLVTRDQVDRIAQLTKFQLPMEVFVNIANKVKSAGRLFAASAFDVASLRAILPHLDAVKIASGDLNFFGLLSVAAKSEKPIILSTGMATLDEIERSIEYIALNATPDARPISERVALMHCISLYPTPLDKTNLAAISVLKTKFGVAVGFSDHTIGIEAALGAVVSGARLIEKHFTLNKQQSGFRDHILSADPNEMTRLASLIHVSDEMFGRAELCIDRPDLEMRALARRSVVASRDLPKDHTILEEDLDFLRPGTGFPPNAINNVIGRRINQPVMRHQQLSQHMFYQET